MLRKSLSILTILAMLITTIAIPAFAADGPTVGIEVNGDPTEVGDIFTVDAYITGLETLRSVQFTIGYDPTKIQAVVPGGSMTAPSMEAAMESDITSINDPTYWSKVFALQSGTLDSTKGLIDAAYSINTNLDTSYGTQHVYTIDNPSENFVIITLRFKVLAEGDSGLRIATEADGSGNYTTANPNGYILWTTGTEVVSSANVVQPELTIGSGEPEPPAKTKIISITKPEAKTVPYGTAFADLGLPAKVSVTDGNSTADISVTWSDAGYDANTASKYTINGTLNEGELDAADFTNEDNLQPTIDVTVEAKPNENQDAPTGLEGVAPTEALNDGKITGTTADMEYKLAADSTYQPASEGETTDLVAGTYHVRYAAKTGFNASPDTTVVVPAYVAPPVEGSTIRISKDTAEDGARGSVVITANDIPEGTKNIDIFISYEGPENFTNVELDLSTGVIDGNFEEKTIDETEGTIGLSAFIKDNVNFDEEQEIAKITFDIIKGTELGEYDFVITSAYYEKEVIFTNMIPGSITIIEAADENYQPALNAVNAYIAAPLSNLDEIAAARDLRETAMDLIDLVNEGAAKDELYNMIADQDAVVGLAAVNEAEDAAKLTFTVEDLEALDLEDVDADNLKFYHLVVGAKKSVTGSDLEKSDLQELINIGNTTYEKGDVNDTGIILSADALLVKEHYLGTEYLTPEQAMKADMDSNGILDDTDVSAILLVASQG